MLVLLIPTLSLRANSLKFFPSMGQTFTFYFVLSLGSMSSLTREASLEEIVWLHVEARGFFLKDRFSLASKMGGTKG